MVVFCQIRDFNSIYKVSGGTLVCTTIMSSRLETAGQIYTISKFDFSISFKNVREVKSVEQDWWAVIEDFHNECAIWLSNTNIWRIFQIEVVSRKNCSAIHSATPRLYGLGFCSWIWVMLLNYNKLTACYPKTWFAVVKECKIWWFWGLKSCYTISM